MKLHVRFRFNRATGEVETLQIDDAGPPLTTAEHDRRHEAKSAEIGRIVERYPRVLEIQPGATPLPAGPESVPDSDSDSAARPGGRTRRQQ